MIGSHVLRHPQNDLVNLLHPGVDVVWNEHSGVWVVLDTFALEDGTLALDELLPLSRRLEGVIFEPSPRALVFEYLDGQERKLGPLTPKVEDVLWALGVSQTGAIDRYHDERIAAVDANTEAEEKREWDQARQRIHEVHRRVMDRANGKFISSKDGYTDERKRDAEDRKRMNEDHQKHRHVDEFIGQSGVAEL